MSTKAVTIRLLAALTLAGTAALAFTPRPALAVQVDPTKMFTLGKVTFEGNQLVSTDTLIAASGLQIGQKVNIDMVKDAFQRIVDEYTKDKVNGTITPTVESIGNKMLVTFKIANEVPVGPSKVVDPIVDHETFTGNRKVSSDKLQPAMTLKIGAPVTAAMINADMQTLAKAYHAADVAGSIAAKVTNLPGGHVDINFEITEGKPKS
jgi:outer membrane protein assembly factor BamA